MRKAIVRLRTELERLNQAVGAVEDVLEQSLAASYEKRLKKTARPAALESISLIRLLQRLGVTDQAPVSRN